MLLTRQFAAAATASLPVAGACLALLFSAPGAHAQAPSGCDDATEVTVLPAPAAPWQGAPLRVLVVSEKPLEGELALVAPNGSVAASSRDRNGGPPYFWYSEVATPAAGTWKATLNRDRAPAGCGAISRDIAVSAAKPPVPPLSGSGSLWPLRNTWNRTTENLYSAWVAKLFDAPPEQELAWKAWHEVLRDKSRNFLFNYFGAGRVFSGCSTSNHWKHFGGRPAVPREQFE